MSVNKNRPHLYVLPEDRANSQLANGFHLEVGHLRQMQVLEEADGWGKVLDKFKSDLVRELDANANCFTVLLIDFDGKSDRLSKAKAAIPTRLADRVFVLGVWTEPEDLKEGRTYESIGKDLATDCRDETEKAWGHELLRHNASEVGRLRTSVRPFLF